MKLILSNETSPYLNLALEEWLLGQKEEFFLVWQNSSSIIVGRNQNTLNEVNLTVAKDSDCKVVRRITGGGAVYHDLGNINLSFIYNVDERVERGEILLEAVIGFLKSKGFDARFTGKNDIMIGERKVSGCAQLERGSRGLIHCTLMHNVNIDMLEKVLKVDGEKLMARGIESVRSRVVNLGSLMAEPEKTRDLLRELADYLHINYCQSVMETMGIDWAKVESLAEKQYKSDKWNFGRDSQIQKKKVKRFECGRVEASVESDGHVITKVSIGGDFVGKLPIEELEKKLSGCFLSEEAVSQRLDDNVLNKYFGKLSLKEFCELII